MEKTNETPENKEMVVKHGPRWERNRKYYLKNTHQSLRSTLLHNIKTNGRIPSEATVQKYSLQVEELIKNWRLYKENVGCELSPIKNMKFKVLIVNLL
jgi:hypothetical protein